MSSHVWVNQAEFCAIYRRTGPWARMNAVQGNFADFGIPTLRVLGAYRGHSRWFFLIPVSLLGDSMINTPLPPSRQKP